MKQLFLADHGSVLCPIWVQRDAQENVAYAAGELANFLSQVAGCQYPVITGMQPPRHCICISDSSDKTLGKEGFTISVSDKGVQIEGGLPRGVIYGAYTFLEMLGCRWFSSKVSKIPRRSCLTVPYTTRREVPALEYRETYYIDSQDGNWSARNKNNGNSMNLDQIRGGKISYYHFVHTFESLMPVDEYFKEHPEYYSLIDGERYGEKNKTQLCLTNPDVLRICTEKVMKWIDQHPEASIFSVSQNDWWKNCQCDSCRAIDEREGSHAGSLITFVNHIAAEVAKKYPDVLIDTLAYQYTRSAPKYLRPLPNVCVRLCSIECCFAHPLRVCDKICSFASQDIGESFQKDLADWSKVCDRLYVWDYVVNFSHYVMPFPNFYVLADNIKYFIENNVKGIFEEGATTQFGGAEFAELRAYVLAKLLWNPDLDTDELVDEFMAGYYEMAAPAIRAYFDLIHTKSAEDPDGHFGIYDPPRVNYLSDDVVAKCEKLFPKALMMASNDDIMERVRIAALPIKYWKVYTMPLNNPQREELSAAFFQELRELGVGEIWEGRSLYESIEQMKKGVYWRHKQ